MSIPPPPAEVNTLGLLLRNATSLSATIIKLLKESDEPVMKDILALLKYPLDGIIMWEEDAVDLGFHLKGVLTDSDAAGLATGVLKFHEALMRVFELCR
jgi:hypothetical protein